jgi:hypothetical protein
MKARIKEMWLAALRSGQYKQAQNTLSDGKGFCCLGVLCNIHALETGTPWRQFKKAVEPCYMGSKTFLPVTVQKWAGLNGTDPSAGGVLLSQRNDIGDTFKQISKLIEKGL